MYQFQDENDINIQLRERVNPSELLGIISIFQILRERISILFNDEDISLWEIKSRIHDSAENLILVRSDSYISEMIFCTCSNDFEI